MMQNLRSCRQIIEALEDKQCNFSCIPSYVWTFIDQSANKIPHDLLSNLKTVLIWRKCLNSVNLWNWESFKSSLHTINSMLVHKNASNWSKMSKNTLEDFIASSNEFYASHRFADLNRFSLFLRGLYGAIF